MNLPTPQKVIIVPFDASAFSKDPCLLIALVESMVEHNPEDYLCRRVDDFVSDMDIQGGSDEFEFNRMVDLANDHLEEFQEAMAGIPKATFSDGAFYITDFKYGPGYLQLHIEDIEE